MSSKRLAELHKRIQFYENLTDAYEKHLQMKNRIIGKQIYRIADLEKQISHNEHKYKGEVNSLNILIKLLKERNERLQSENNILKRGGIDV